MNDLGRWYQTAIVNGVPMPAERRGDTHQRRWAELVAPLVSPDGDGRLVVDLGCNAGFYLREFARLGYRTLGVERDERFLAQAAYWEAVEPLGVRVVRGDIATFDVPACFTAVLANVHYWLEPDVVAGLLERLWDRALFVVVTSKVEPRADHLMNCTEYATAALFHQWDEVSAYRAGRHWSGLWRNPSLCEVETEALYECSLARQDGHANEHLHRWFFPAFGDFVRRTLAGERFDPEASEYGEYLRRWGMRYRPALYHWYGHLIESAREEGIREPLTLCLDGAVQNGHHRLVVARELGIKRLICRQLA